MNDEALIQITLWRPRTMLDWLDWCLGKGRYPKADRPQIIADAERLLNNMSGGEAYHAACELERASPPIVDPLRSPRHWWHVREAIADHLNIVIGQNGYDR